MHRRYRGLFSRGACPGAESTAMAIQSLPAGAMVFGLGLSKTGTHSLNHALEDLGIPSVHYPEPAQMVAGRFEEALGGHRGATDISVSAFYRELDAAYPGSRFILTLRDVPEWLVSVADHRARRDGTPPAPGCPKAIIRRMLYTSAKFDRGLYEAGYHAHERDVRGYFRDRPRDLLVMNICAGEGWEVLCPFLGVDAPAAPFPARNRRAVAVE
jgi:hypothetical protein